MSTVDQVLSLKRKKPQQVSAKALPVAKKQKQVEQKTSKVEEESPDLLDPRVQEILRKFDCSSKYGPKFNISRKDRYLRAKKLGKAVPPELDTIFEAFPDEADFVWTLEAMMHRGSEI